MARWLFVSPVMPAVDGHGAAMRAGLFLDALARRHEVHLLVVPVFSLGGAAGSVSSFVRERVARVVVEAPTCVDDPPADVIAALKTPGGRERVVEFILSRARRRMRDGTGDTSPFLCRFARREIVRRATSRFADVTFDVVQAMYVYLAPFVLPFLDGNAAKRPVAMVDLPDDESTTRLRISALHAENGNRILAELEAIEAAKYDTFERAVLQRFDRVLVCSEVDRIRLEDRLGLREVAVIPNGVRMPPSIPNGSSRSDFLFIGTLGYPPNADASAWFATRVLPLLQRQLGRRATTVIVGRDPPLNAARLAELPGITLVANAPAVAPYYGGARVVVVPLRAGGGTRLKILEALSFAKPVVTTTVGLEGIDAMHGTHLLVADSPERFAAACLRLLEQPAAAAQLATAGYRLVEQRYSWPVLGRLIEDKLAP